MDVGVKKFMCYFMVDIPYLNIFKASTSIFHAEMLDVIISFIILLALVEDLVSKILKNVTTALLFYI